MLRRPRTALVGAALLALLLVAAGCSSGGDDPKATATASGTSTASAASATCGYLYEWVTDLPLPPAARPARRLHLRRPQGDRPGRLRGDRRLPVRRVDRVDDLHRGLTQGASPFSVVKDSAITPDQGSVNPFVPGTAVQEREARLPAARGAARAPTRATLPRRCKDVPASNVLTSPTTGYRVRRRQPGLRRLPRVQPGRCGRADARRRSRRCGRSTSRRARASTARSSTWCPNPKPPTDDAHRLRRADAPAWSRCPTARPFGAGVGAGSLERHRRRVRTGLDPAYIEFTRPPLLPGADVSSGATARQLRRLPRGGHERRRRSA